MRPQHTFRLSTQQRVQHGIRRGEALRQEVLSKLEHISIVTEFDRRLEHRLIVTLVGGRSVTKTRSREHARSARRSERAPELRDHLSQARFH